MNKLEKITEKDGKSSQQQMKYEEIKQTSSNDEKPIYYRQLEETPFTIARTENDKFVVLLGKYRLTEDIDEEEQAIKEGYAINWNRILQVCHVVAKESYKELINEIEVK